MSVSSVIPGARFVDPKVLSRIGNLELLARSVVDGFTNGVHRSPQFGVSMDFAEHRGYVAGDDIRRVDWRLYARTDRYYVKQYEADTNTNFSVLLDVSKSMSFGPSGVSKLEYAKYLAACLTHLANKQRDRVGLVTFDRDVVDRVPPSAKHFDVVLHHLDRAVAQRPGLLQEPLKKMAEFFGRRSILAVISDLYEEPEAIVSGLGTLRSRGNDVVVFHVLDPAEVDFPFTEASSFEDIESGEQAPIVPNALADEYRALVAAHIATLRSKLTAQQIDYMQISTAAPLDLALFTYLSSRDRSTRVR